MRFGGALIIAAALAGAPAAAAADEEPICADRPGLSTPTCTVPAGMIQVETTLADWTRDRSGGVRVEQLAIGETAVKLGVTDRLHVEVAVAPYTRVRARSGAVRQTVTGLGDLGMAAKYRVTADGAPMQLALYPYFKLPTAKRSLGNGKVEGGLIVPIGYAIPGSALSLTLGPEIGVVADSDGNGHHLAIAQVAALGFPLSPRLSAAAELWGGWDWDPAGTVRQYAAGASGAYLLSNDMQIDAGVNLGLNSATPDVQLYSGFAFRF